MYVLIAEEREDLLVIIVVLFPSIAIYSVRVSYVICIRYISHTLRYLLANKKISIIYKCYVSIDTLNFVLFF